MGFILYCIMLLLIIYSLELLTAAHMVTLCELKKKGAALLAHTAAEVSVKIVVQIVNDYEVDGAS